SRWEKAYAPFDLALTQAGSGYDAYFAASPGWTSVSRTASASLYRRTAPERRAARSVTEGPARRQAGPKKRGWPKPLVGGPMTAGAWIPPWVRHMHLARYEWVSEFTRALTVLDAACGTGYGSPILMRNGTKSVDGFDLSPEAIREAGEQHGAPGLEF